MPSPFITTMPKGSEGNVLATLQTHRQTQPGRSEDFSSVFEHRVREQEAPSPSRATPQAPARHGEATPERQNKDASDNVQRAEPAEREPQPEGDTAEATARSTDSDTPAEGQPAAAPTTADATGQPPEAEAVSPASLAAVASIIAALDRGLPTANAGIDSDTGTIDDATLDTLSRRAQGFLFSNPFGKAARSGNQNGSATLANGSEAALAPKGGQGRNAAPTLPTTTMAAQIQAAASPAARFGTTPAMSLHSATAEMPVAGLSSTGLVAALRGDPGPIPQLQVHTPAGQRAWAEDVGSRMLWMVGRGESRAELVLTPPSLGKLGISIQVNGDQTSAHFVAATAAAREALEQAMPRLREALQQAGISLGQTNVSTSGEQQTRGDGRDEQVGNGGRIRDLPLDADAPLAQLPGQRWTSSGTGVIDTFA